jgi:hypothetical protein
MAGAANARAGAASAKAKTVSAAILLIRKRCIPRRRLPVERSGRMS